MVTPSHAATGRGEASARSCQVPIGCRSAAGTGARSADARPGLGPQRRAIADQRLGMDNVDGRYRRIRIPRTTWCRATHPSPWSSYPCAPTEVPIAV